MDEHQAAAPPPTPTTPAPHPALRGLDPLVGTWRLENRDADGSPTTSGTVVRSWLPGGHFLVQQVVLDGEEAVGAEYVGWDHEHHVLRSMYFSAEGPGPFCSFALEYVWRIEGEELTIWHGAEGSPARFTGTVDRDAGRVTGAWEWPGGGYRSTETRRG